MRLLGFNRSFRSLWIGQALANFGDVLYIVALVSLLLCVLMGPAYQVRDISQLTLFQTQTEERKLSKVFAARGTLVHALFGPAVLLMGVIAEQVHVSAAYLTAAVLFGLSALLGFTHEAFRSARNVDLSA